MLLAYTSMLVVGLNSASPAAPRVSGDMNGRRDGVLLGSGVCGGGTEFITKKSITFTVRTSPSNYDVL
jgi:hypothetical protein